MSAAVITAVGLCTPLGLDVETTSLEMEAGTARFVETETLLQDEVPARACRLPLLPLRASRSERIAALATTACLPVFELLRNERIPRVALFLALPEADESKSPPSDTLVAALRSASEGAPAIELASVWRTGRAAPFHALATAASELCGPSPNQPEAALVCAVDSLCDPASLARLVAARRILGPETRDGLLPGEGAAALLVLRQGRARALGLPILGTLVAHATAIEPVPFDQDRGSAAAARTPVAPAKPSLSQGLTEAFRAIRKAHGEGNERPTMVLSAQTGESFWAQELARAFTRNAEIVPVPCLLQIAGQSFGDAGAAAGGLLIGAALHRVARDQREGPRQRFLAYGCSDDGKVGACLVETEGSTG